MPFGGFTDWDDCIKTMLEQGKSKDSAEKICGKLKSELEGSPSSATKEAVDIVSLLLTENPDMDITLKGIESIIEAFTKWAGGDPGNYTKCVNTLKGKPGITNPDALCAWLHKKGTGKWPAEKGFTLEGPIVTKDASKHIVVGPVMIPGEKDHEGEAFNPERIEQAAHEFMERFRYVDVSHTLKQVGTPVTSDLLRVPETYKIDGEDYTLPVGTWMLGTKLNDEAWKGVESGKLKGYSIMGVARHEFDRALEASKGLPAPRGMIWDNGVLRKTKLEDLGPDWVPVAVSVIENPSVFKSRFVVTKGEGEGDGLVNKIIQTIADWFSHKGKGDSEQFTLTKQGGEEMDDKEIKDLIQKEIKDSVGPAVKEAVKDLLPKEEPDKDDDKTKDTDKNKTTDQDKDKAKGSDDDADDKDKGDKDNDVDLGEEITALKTGLKTLTETVEKMTKTGVKSQGLPADDKDKERTVDPNDHPRDAWGRARAK